MVVDSTDEGIAEGCDTDEDDYDLLEPLEQDSEMDETGIFWIWRDVTSTMKKGSKKTTTGCI
jgi:hypothetical protein